MADNGGANDDSGVVSLTPVLPLLILPGAGLLALTLTRLIEIHVHV